MIKKKNEVTLESLGKKIDVSATTLSARIDGLDKKVDRLDKKVEKIDASIRKLGVEVEKLSHNFILFIEGFSSLSERTDKVENRVSLLEGKRA